AAKHSEYHGNLTLECGDRRRFGYFLSPPCCSPKENIQSGDDRRTPKQIFLGRKSEMVGIAVVICWNGASSGQDVVNRMLGCIPRRGSKLQVLDLPHGVVLGV